MKYLLLIALIAFSGFAVWQAILSAPSKTIDFSLKKDLLTALINDWRISQELQPYIEEDRLCEIANDRATDGDDNHAGFKKKYYSYEYKLSENLVTADTEELALKGWLSSPPHRTTLLKPYTHSCIACKDKFCVQIFSSFEK